LGLPNQTAFAHCGSGHSDNAGWQADKQLNQEDFPMGNEDWINKIFDEKKAQNDTANLEAAVENNRRKKFEAQADDFRNQLAAMFSKAVDEYNGHVSSNAQRIQYTVPSQLVFEAFKLHDPSGHLTVELNKDTEQLICQYQYSGTETDHSDSRIMKIVAVNNHLNLKLYGRAILEGDEPQVILSDFFRKVCQL
jgi:hypothetical protein